MIIMNPKRIIQDQQGQTMAEFAIVLPVLLMLFIWAFQFYDMLAIKHKTIEAARFAAWERAYGSEDDRNVIISRTQNIIQNTQTIINEPENVQADMDILSSLDNSLYFNSVGRIRLWQLGIISGISESDSSFVVTNASATYNLSFTAGLASVPINSNSALVFNSWDLETVTGGSSNDHLEDAVGGIFWFIPQLKIINKAFEVINKVLNFIEGILSILGISLNGDIYPMGKVDMYNVPYPEK